MVRGDVLIRFGEALHKVFLPSGFLGVLGTYLLWFLLYAAFWNPYWRELRDLGIYTHDIEGGYLIIFGPPIVGLFFLLASFIALSCAWILPGVSRRLQVARLLLFLVPSVAVFAMLNLKSFGRVPFVWRYPLAELSVLLVGIGIGQLPAWSTIFLDREITKGG
jgi:hypothetical protein